MDLSVIIVNYNVRDFLNNALVSIFKALEGIGSEVFVVDNASDDGSLEMVEQNFPNVQLIANDTNVGFGMANNQVLGLTKGKYIMLINPDTVVQEDTFRKLMEFCNANPDVGMVGCKILNPDGTLQLACRRSFPTPWTALTKVFGLSALFPHSRLFARYNLTYLDPDENYEVDAVSGSCMMLRRDVYEKVGGFDERFFMYGEDLDLCYRVQRAGWKVFYVADTKIIHYKGESTRRSDIDELKVFYDAMRLFVRKHRTGSVFSGLVIESGIHVRRFLAACARIGRPFVVAAFDAVIVVLTILLAEFIRRGTVFAFPSYAYPWALIVPSLIVVTSLFFSGVYSYRRLSISRSLVGVLFAYLLISALTAFFRDFAFSRGMVLISGIASTLCIVGLRLAVRLVGSRETLSRKTLFGRRTIIVGTGSAGQEVLRKLRTRVGNGYSVVGFIDINRQRVGQKVFGVEILGSVDMIGKVINEFRISEVIFSTDAIPYSTILSVISRNRDRSVSFRLVPNTLEVIIGKTSVDQLDEMPFIDIEYNINRTPYRFLKRAVDISASLLFLISCAPFVYLKKAISHSTPSAFSSAVLMMSKVLGGSMSLVGRPLDTASMSHFSPNGIYLGKPGITGIVQIHSDKGLSETERTQYELYYAKNQSLLLDIEILLKTVFRPRRYTA